LRLERAVQAAEADNAVRQKGKAARLVRLLSSLSSYRAALGSKETEALAAADAIRGPDPRLRWLADRGRRWRDQGEKTLVFVADRHGLEEIRQGLSRTAQIRTGVFHEELSAAQRDIEVAQFRTASGPSMLVSTECGGEGRNFEFCTRLVLWDLPWNPAVVEQRIGRLDRIGRTQPTEIVVFRPHDGIGLGLVDAYERLGLFERPLGGLTRELAGVGEAIERAVLDAGPGLDADRLRPELALAEEAKEAIDAAAWRELHQEPFRAEDGDAILARVPEGLDELTEDVVVAACEHLNLRAEPVRVDGRWSVGWTGRARVESLPGVAGGSSYLGTFSRTLAVEDESIDFFASGHPWVEGLLAWIEDAQVGRTALLRLKGPPALGLAGFARGANDLDVAAVDAFGAPQPEWERRLGERPLKSRRLKLDEWQAPPGWEPLVRACVTAVETRLGRPAEALAVLWFEP